MMSWRRTMALVVLTTGCRPHPPSAPVLSSPSERPRTVASDSERADDEPHDEPPAKPLVLRDFPAAREVFDQLGSAPQRPVFTLPDAQVHDAEPFITDLQGIAKLDVAMAAAWLERLDTRSAWGPLFGGEAEFASRGAKEAVSDAMAARPPVPDPSVLRLIISPFGMGGARSIRFNALGVIDDGRLETIYADPFGGFAGFIPTPNHDGVLLVHDVERGYHGAIVPRTFSEVSFTLVSVPELEATHLMLRCGELLDSVTVSMAPTKGNAAALHLRLRHSRSSRFAVLECDFEGNPCTLLPREPLHGDVPALEVTASTSYRVEPLASELALPSDVLRRTVHASADGRWLSFVTQQLIPMSPDPDWSRTLWVAHADGSSPRPIAEGWGWFHARWEADGTLSFDADPTPSASVARLLDAQRDEDSDWQPTAHQQQRLDVMFAGIEAMRDESISHPAEYLVGHHDPVSQETRTERTMHPTRLWASFSIPNITGSAPDYVEVPFDPEDETEVSDPHCTVVR